MFWRFIYSHQLRAIFEWLSRIVTEKDIILVNLPEKQGYFYFEFPLRYRDKPKVFKEKPEEEKITFVVRRPFRQEKQLADQWIQIFSSPEVEIFENKNRISETLPLRFKLGEKEKELSLKIARDSLDTFLSTGKSLNLEHFNNVTKRFRFKTDLCVALWTRGRLRGSVVLEDRHFGEGIAESAILAARDSRFKPLDISELNDTRIEVTVMSDLRIPIKFLPETKNYIHHEKGYLLEKSGKMGWFLPEVHNVRRYRNLENFFGDLAEEKAGLERDSYKKSKIFIFEVDDFIESNNHEKALSLSGPVVSAFQNQTHEFEKFFLYRLNMAADWLCENQEPDGNMPPVINALSGQKKQIDWPRFIFTARALAEFGVATKENKYLIASEKSFKYIKKYLFSNVTIKNYELSLAYYGQLALTLSKLDEAAVVADKLCRPLSNAKFEPITFAQTGSFLKDFLKHNNNYSGTFENVLKNLKNNLEKEINWQKDINLALWAETANTFFGIDREFYKKIIAWLLSRQMPNGAFTESTDSNFAYTRGTGKILEVLATETLNVSDEISKALKWFTSMQYDEENTYFVPYEIRPKIIGGFRHDYFNQEAWIDSAGHFLLAGARLLAHKTKA